MQLYMRIEGYDNVLRGLFPDYYPRTHNDLMIQRRLAEIEPSCPVVALFGGFYLPPDPPLPEPEPEFDDGPGQDENDLERFEDDGGRAGIADHIDGFDRDDLGESPDY